MTKIEEITDRIHSIPAWPKKKKILEDWAHEIIEECAKRAGKDSEELVKQVKDDL